MRTPTYLIALLFLFMTSHAQAQFCLDGKCYGGPQQTVVRSQAPVLNGVTRVVDGAAVVVQAPVQIASNVARTAYQVTGAIVNRDPAAYSHALREATIQAQRGRVGHFLGCAPGATFSGVGNSFSANQPNHCTTRRGTLVARAVVRGSDGRYYWSAHYR